MIQLNCPKCHKPVNISMEDAKTPGRLIECPHCLYTLRIRRQQAPSLPPKSETHHQADEVEEFSILEGRQADKPKARLRSLFGYKKATQPNAQAAQPPASPAEATSDTTPATKNSAASQPTPPPASPTKMLEDGDTTPATQDSAATAQPSQAAAPEQAKPSANTDQSAAAPNIAPSTSKPPAAAPQLIDHPQPKPHTMQPVPPPHDDMNWTLATMVALVVLVMQMFYLLLQR